MHDDRSATRVEPETVPELPVLTVEGVLDSSTYRTVRDVIIKAAIDEPRAVIVDVNRLQVPSASAWTVFTSARWHVSVWPDVPILLVCASPEVRRTIRAAGVSRMFRYMQRWSPPWTPRRAGPSSSGGGRAPALRETSAAWKSRAV